LNRLLVILPLALFCLTVQGQVTDSSGTFRTEGSLEEVNTGSHNPTKAVILSAIIPGTGQLYNRKWWKAGLFWAGLGAGIYAIHFNETEMMRYRGAYIDRNNGQVDEFPFYSDDQLEVLYNFYRRNRDLSILITTGVYFLNILDAYVDAKLVDFDVSDNLTMRIEPSVQQARGREQAYGVALKFNF
jgi:hypothetical protein